MKLVNQLNRLFKSFTAIVVNRVEAVQLNKNQIRSLAETLREIGANLIVAILITTILEKKTNYLHQALSLIMAIMIWYTSFVIYKNKKG